MIFSMISHDLSNTFLAMFASLKTGDLRMHSPKKTGEFLMKDGD